MKNFVFGDTGGHKDGLLAALKSIGLDEQTFLLPEGVRVIHVGDLIHKGPDSAGVIELVDKILRANPAQWVQLMGNHELQYIKGAPHFWRETVAPETVQTFGRWWNEGLINFAFATDQVDLKIELTNKPVIEVPKAKDILFTHSGVTRWFWDDIGQPANAFQAADIINNTPIPQVSAAGVMLYGGMSGAKRLKPGPMWALSTEEVFVSWVLGKKEMPFIQVHGHTAAWNWMRKQWWGNTPKAYRDNTKLNPVDRVSITRVCDSVQIGVDPGFENVTDLDSQPYLFFESTK